MSAFPPRLDLLKRPAVLLLSLVVVLSSATCRRAAAPLPPPVPAAPPVSAEPTLRIRLLDGVPAVRLGGGRSGVLFRDAGNGKNIAMLTQNEQWDAVRFSEKAQLRVAMPDGRVSRDHPDGIFAEGPGGEPVTVDGRAYRGKVYVFSLPDGNLRVINEVSMEQYLRSVVPAEIGPLGDSFDEALKAQAVASRSFALARLRQQSRNPQFDLTADTGDQVYQGIERESPAADRAVAATRGQVLVWRGQVVSAYYHSTCGGRTASPEEVWGEDFARTAPFLRSVADRDFDRGSRWLDWQVKWTRRELLDILKRYLPAVAGVSSAELGEPSDIEILERGSSGRNTLLKVTTDRRTVQLRGDQMRRALRQKGGAMLPSTHFTLALSRENGEPVVTASGHGFGHGLGMCQWGAKARAEAGQDYRRILEHYYRDVSLERMY